MNRIVVVTLLVVLLLGCLPVQASNHHQWALFEKDTGKWVAGPFNSLHDCVTAHVHHKPMQKYYCSQIK